MPRPTVRTDSIPMWQNEHQAVVLARAFSPLGTVVPFFALIAPSGLFLLGLVGSGVFYLAFFIAGGILARHVRTYWRVLAVDAVVCLVFLVLSSPWATIPGTPTLSLMGSLMCLLVPINVWLALFWLIWRGLRGAPIPSAC